MIDLSKYSNVFSQLYTDKLDIYRHTNSTNEDGTINIYQTWDLEKIKKFYEFHQEDIWVGHNIKNYDNLILEAIYKDKNVYNVSKHHWHTLMLDNRVKYFHLYFQ